LKDVRSEQRGPQLFISRVAPEFLMALFTLEVPKSTRASSKSRAPLAIPVPGQDRGQEQGYAIDPVGLA